MAATRCYAVAIVLLLLGWAGTDRDLGWSLTSAAPGGDARNDVAPRWKLAVPLVIGALAINAAGVVLLRGAAYRSWIGASLWLSSLALLVLSGVVARPLAAGRLAGAVDQRRWASRSLEAAAIVGLLVLAFAFRFYRLGDWTTGVHGDEGEAGMDALAIVEGSRPSPFANGWYAQPNFYYWAIAIGLKLFGTDLLGLRMFSAVAGWLLVIPVYLLARLWFGTRTAVIAGVLVAISDVAVHFSRQEFGNITTPLFLTTGAYFLFRGLRRGRWVDFVLAGFAHASCLYFYIGGRLTPIIAGATLVYLAVVPALLGILRALRHSPDRPGERRLAGLRGTIKAELATLRPQAAGYLLYAVALACFVSPWAAYYLDHLAEGNARAGEKIIFNNEPRMVQQHGVDHSPLYLGLAWPDPADAVPLPVSFSETPVSVRLFDDGFWPRALWHQLLATLSIFTYRADASSVYTFTQEPVAKPIEAVLIVLGIAWALWRWRDARMASLSIWFWLTVGIGGALTIDAPYMARLVGVIPVTAIVAAVVVDRLLRHAESVATYASSFHGAARVARWIGGIAIVSLLGYLTWQNAYDYYFRYVGPWCFREGTGQAVFVREMNRRVAAEGRPVPRYYHLGVHYIYWSYGPNRFLNHGTPGADVPNVAEILPLLDDEDRDAVFMVWPVNAQYLTVLRHYYPNGIEEPFLYGRPEASSPLLVSYRVNREEIRSRRVAAASYRGADGRVVERTEASLGSSTPFPSDLAYPAAAQWSSELFAPSFDRYGFRLAGPPDASLWIDGEKVASGAAETTEVVLARGAHLIELRAPLLSAQDRVEVSWSPSGAPLTAVDSRYLWSGGSRGFLGDVRTAVASGESPRVDSPVMQRRIDGFLGFRDTERALGTGPLRAEWNGKTSIQRDGRFLFSLISSGGTSRLWIDGAPVVEGSPAGAIAEAVGEVDLTAGEHAMRVEYERSAASGYLELYWSPTAKREDKRLLGPAELAVDGGLWQPEEISIVVHGAAPSPAGATILKAPVPVGDRARLGNPYSIAVDDAGRIVTADTDNHRVVVIEGEKVVRFGREGDDPGEFGILQDVAIDRGGNIYTLESTPARVQVFSPAGDFERVLAQGPWCAANGFALDSEGAVYVAETCGNRIFKLGPQGAVLSDFRGGDDPQTRLEQPIDVAIDDGDVFAVDLRRRLMRIDPASGGIVTQWAVEVGVARGAAMLQVRNGVAYLSDPDRNVLYRIVKSSSEVEVLAAEGGLLKAPMAVAVGARGELFVGTEGAQGILRFEPVGE